MFKIVHGFDDIAKEEFFQMGDTSMSGHSKKIFKPRSNKSIRYNSFDLRIMEDCNSLPQGVISSTSVL